VLVRRRREAGRAPAGADPAREPGTVPEPADAAERPAER